MKIQYFIGKNSHTKMLPLENFDFLEKQFALSIPLITKVTIFLKEKKKEKQQSIYVGKEILLTEIKKENSLLEKYGISMEDLADVYALGFKRACLLNFKKYDPILVGMNQEDLVVPDYFALKKALFGWKTL